MYCGNPKMKVLSQDTKGRNTPHTGYRLKERCSEDFFKFHTAWVTTTLPVSGLILQSDILFHLRNHIFPCRGFSVILRSKPGLQPSLVPTVEEQQDGHWSCKILANPRWSFLPSPLLYFLILPSSAQFCANIFFLAEETETCISKRGCGYPAADVSTWRPKSKLIWGSQGSKSGGLSCWMK